MKLVYFGSPEAAVAPLRALHEAGHEVVLVVSGADKRRGRGKTLTPTPVKAAALELGLPVTDDLQDVMGVSADLGVVVAFGRIIRPEMLDHLQMVNLHFSLLPRWRGAAPVERAILAGDPVTGVCVMAVEEGLDTGGVFACEEVEVGPTESAVELRDRLTTVGSALLVRTLDRGLGEPAPQSDEGVTYAEKIRPEDRMISAAMTTEQFLRIVRIGGAWTEFRGKRLKIAAARTPEAGGVSNGPSSVPIDSSAAQNADPSVQVRPDASPGEFIDGAVVKTLDGFVELLLVQPEGKPVMSAADWARGAHPSGDRIDT
ncbi:MAG TPA: methionyl-tRNA formyltransferase [Microthrixaceae bacterium]|nr:methionyl-tRNA formyltransferase [Microthrixaceae bacterium]